MAALRKATVVVQRERDNRIFQPGAGPNGGDFFLPWRALREAFAAAGYALNTADVNAGEPVAFELHLNAQRRLPSDRPCYAYLYEDPLVRPLNANRAHLAHYRRLWTWDQSLIDQQHVLALAYPNDLAVRPVPGWDGRDLHCVMLASNKALRYPDARNLHDQRVTVIRAFEARCPDRFALFGRGWQIPAVQPGAWGRIRKRLQEWRVRSPWPPAQPPFPSWRGPAHRKSDVLDRARFSICYENTHGNPGYLTEKIFDCMTSGSVPVYLGVPPATLPMPADCYIDGAALRDPVHLIAALDAVNAAAFARHQAAMRSFLQSPAAQPHTNAHWCQTLVQGICAEQRALGLA